MEKIKETKKAGLVFLFIISIIFFISGIYINVNAFNVISYITFYSETGLVHLIFENGLNIIITSPQNITYNFSKGANYTLNLNVSSPGLNITNYSYSLYDLRHNIWVYNNVSFSPNTTFNAVRWSNRLDVFGVSSSNQTYNNSVVFFVFVNNSAPIIKNMTHRLYACENSQLSYLFNATDIDEDSLSAVLDPQYPNSPFYISFGERINLTTTNYEIFSGTLSKDDSGGVNNGSKVYNETVSVNDGEYSDYSNLNITVIEVNNFPVIDDIGVHTIWSRGDNSTFYYKVIANDSEDGNSSFGNLIFNVSFSHEKLFNISSDGVINFTANASQVGVYNITVNVRDKGLLNPYPNMSAWCGQNGSPITSSKKFSLTITDENRAPIILSHFPINLSFNVSGETNLYFNISFRDPDTTVPDVYWYLDDELKRYKSGGELSDSYNYSFPCGVSGYYKLRAVITDGELNSSVQWNLSVNKVDCPIIPPGGGGGGAGSAVKELNCTPKWGCSEWGVCEAFDNIYSMGFDAKIISSIKNNCSLNKWNSSICGFQQKTCNLINGCGGKFLQPASVQACYYTKNPNCNDSIKNCHDGSCEVLTDCGGPCAPCPSCSDGILNQGEERIDCGGPCSPCIETPRSFISFYWIYAFILLFLIILFIIIRFIFKNYQLIKELVVRRGLNKGNTNLDGSFDKGARWNF